MAKNFVLIKFAGDASSLRRELGSLDSSMGKTATKSSKLKMALKTGAIAGLAALGTAARIGWGEFTEGQKVAAQTNAVLKSTGRIANVTAEDVESLSTAIMRKTGIDDEAIAAGQNMLLTFTKVRNEVGRGNDIFTQATRRIVDMSVALGKDMNSSALMVGKALNDPIRGVTALTRAGVQFSKAQRDAIKAMVDSGDVMGAQKIILKELEVQFGGSAEAAGKTLPGQINIAKETLSNFAGQGVEVAVKALANMVMWIQTNWPKIKASIEPTVRSVMETIETVWGRIGPVVKTQFNAIINVVKPTLETVQAIIETVMAIIRGDWSEAWDGIKDIVRGALRLVEAIVRGWASTIRAAATAIGRAILDGIKAGVAGLARLGTDLLHKAQQAVAGMALGVYETATSIGKAIVNGIVAGIKSLPNAVRDAVIGVASRAKDGVKSFLGINSPSKVFAEEVGVGIPEGMAKGIKEKAPEVARETVAAVTAAVRQAKQSLGNMGSDLAGRLGSFIDSKAAKASTALDNSEEANRLRAIRAQQERENTVRERYRLEHAVATAADAQALAEAQQALSDWQLEQEASALSASLDAKRAKIAEEAEARKVAAERGLTDLTDSLNRGLITQGEFVKGINAILRSSEHDYKESGALLGSAFARGFREQMRGIFKQGNAIATGPKRKGSGSAPEIVRPKAAKKSHTGSIVPGRRGAEVPMILLAGQRVLPPGQRSASGGGGPVYLTVQSLDPRESATLVMEALREYERTRGQQFARA